MADRPDIDKRERLLERGGLEQGREAAERAFTHRCGSKIGQGRPDERLGLGPKRHPFPGEQPRQPIDRPCPFARIVDTGQRLKAQGARRGAANRGAQIVGFAAHAQGGGADRGPEVEGDDLSVRVATELQGGERQEDAFPRPRRADQQGVADVVDMGLQKSDLKLARGGFGVTLPFSS